ncbi:G protein-activated inward rectifier potassium channel 3 [Strongylocentrotus purpuratus]|uniref:G protein-activated inward rectifier potassium channel 3 n=1 Tax=Strongylocentrotus purpuratus TaxID=7668 RepID=A0A7M7LSG3_STRPU|nr:G protein-activated inward rectifier potassium channel 3 [Strongylocentrotus purpuratus]
MSRPAGETDLYEPLGLMEPPRMEAEMDRRVSNTSLSSESAYSSNGNGPPIPTHHNRKDSVRSYKLRRKLKRRKQMQRLVGKDGVCNVVHTRVARLRFIEDLFTTFVDLRWRWNLMVFTFAYVVGWFLFGLVWFVIAAAHGDLNASQRNLTDWEPCVYNMETFTGAFLFSLETQTTIGYGFRSVTEECPHAVLLVVVQSVISCLIDAVFIGCIFAKIARPKKRAATLKFSRKAAIAQRDGKLCFMFRVGDIRNSHLFEAHLRVYMIKPKVTKEGEIIPLCHHNMDLGYDTGEDRIFLVWPIIVSHTIDEDSPLYEYSCNTIDTADFEIVVILEGIVEQTGLTTQARTSYMPGEIQWGSRFCSSVLCLRSEFDKQYDIDYSKFEETYTVPGHPRKSAKELDEIEQKEEETTESQLAQLKDLITNVIDEQKLQRWNPRMTEEVFARRFKQFARGDCNGRSRSTEHLTLKWKPPDVGRLVSIESQGSHEGSQEMHPLRSCDSQTTEELSMTSHPSPLPEEALKEMPDEIKRKESNV